MYSMVKDWFKRYFSDPEAIGLLFVILAVSILLFTIGQWMAPAIVSVVLAYLLSGLVNYLDRLKFPHTLSTSVVCLVFIGAMYLGILVLMPIIWDQIIALGKELPSIFNKTNNYLVGLHQQYPDYVSVEQMQQLFGSFKTELTSLGQYAVTISLASLSNIVSVIVYLVLVPLLVFFMLRDQTLIVTWFDQFIPRRRKLIRQVWIEVNTQIGNYIRAKVLEIVLVSLVTVLTFFLLKLNYAVLLGVLVGLSALIPFVGITIVTIPVVIVAYLQWGWTIDFAYLVIAYAIIAILDGNVLATLLFSEAVKLHPIAVIVAILFFGGLWGFWGIFFAIPLATLVKALLNAWPRTENAS